MTIVKQKPVNKTVKPPEKLAHERLAVDRMQDVRLLLQNLVNSEEATVKLVLDCLYDLAAVNLSDQKFRTRFLNKTMILIAGMSKPVVRVFAWQWFKKNSPELITNWLQTQVTFADPITKPKEVAIEILEVQPYSPLEAESLRKQVKYLRHQARWLTAITIVAFSALGITVTMLTFSSRTPLQSRQQVQSIMPD